MASMLLILGLLSPQTGGRESTGSRKLFSKGKGKERVKSSSDGDLDDREKRHWIVGKSSTKIPTLVIQARHPGSDQD